MLMWALIFQSHRGDFGSAATIPLRMDVRDIDSIATNGFRCLETRKGQ